MGVHTEKNKLVIKKTSKTFYFDLPKDVDNNLMHAIDFIIKHNEVLAEHTVKMRLVNCCSNMSMEVIFMNTENSKTHETHKFVVTLLQRLDLRSLNKHVALQNMSIYYIWKSIRQQSKNSKLKIIAPTWKDDFE